MSGDYPDKYLIGLTGNIAVGKSLVRQCLVDLGAAAIDADRVAHQVILRGGPAFDDVVQAFGAEVIGADGEINRAALGKIVFADQAKLRALEAITHPPVREVIHQRIRSAERRVVVIEAIKLLEGNLRQVVDAVWVVNAAPETRLKRLMRERGLSEHIARQRMAAQHSQADKLRLADVIIENDGDAAETREQVRRHWRDIRHRGPESTE
ncbi:MAG: dephospho-CoA kinase [Chloroflexi bacterium]|nr:dephospho-CoA kinase [Chloroflexota bacterium]